MINYCSCDGHVYYHFCFTSIIVSIQKLLINDSFQLLKVNTKKDLLNNFKVTFFLLTVLTSDNFCFAKFCCIENIFNQHILIFQNLMQIFCCTLINRIHKLFNILQTIRKLYTFFVKFTNSVSQCI